MQLLINASDDLPIYRQIMRQIMEAIAGGRLTAGDRLASHRELSEQLVIAPLTVKKAYDELEKIGYLDTQRGRGTFVAAHPPRITRAAHGEDVAEAARALLSKAYLAGLTFPDVVTALRDANRALTDGSAIRHRIKGKSA
jgi:GntR family transcriptional regulator